MHVMCVLVHVHVLMGINVKCDNMHSCMDTSVRICRESGLRLIGIITSYIPRDCN